MSINKRKTLAIDVDTYNLLDDICKNEYRSIIHELTYLIKKEHARLFSESKHGD